MTNPTLLLPLAIATDERGLGYWFGLALLPLALTFGVYKCAVIARRNTACTKCLAGLGMVLCGLLCITLTALAIVLGVLPGDSANVRLVPFAGMGLIAAGAVCALFGLIRYRSVKPPLRQGRKQAFAALIVGGCLFSVFVRGLLK